VLGVVTAFYVAASIACFGLPSAPPIERVAGEERRSLMEPIRELRDGLAVVRREPTISRPIVLLATATSVASLLGVLGPSLAVTVGLEPQNLAVVVIPLGIGVVVGILGLRRFGERWPRRRVAEGGLLVLGVLTAALAGAGWLDGTMRSVGIPVGALPVVIVTAVIAGAAYAVTSVTAQTNLTESTPADVRGGSSGTGIDRVRGLAHPVAHRRAGRGRLSTGAPWPSQGDPLGRSRVLVDPAPGVTPYSSGA
jgi:predicted MFS family arabinose efflux permease